MSPVQVLPIFPLPQVVLLPGAVMPFHIFESRYVQMIEHVMKKPEPLIVMSRLLPCSEMDYYLNPDMEEVGCIGQIVMHKRNDNNTHDIMLMGVERARIVEAPSSDQRLYRCVEVYPSPVPELGEDEQAWLNDHEETIASSLSRNRETEFTREIYKKWRDGFISARSVLHIFVHTLVKDPDELQMILADDTAEIAMNKMKQWLANRST